VSSPGEIFALGLEDIDFDAKVVHVRRQLKLVRYRSIFGLPKGRKRRDVPLPDSVAAAIRQHMKRFPPVEVTLPWDRPDGDPVTVPLLITTSARTAVNRKWFAPDVWHLALRAAGVIPGRDNGLHALRHFYASSLLHAGESVKALSEYLGHHDAGFTLRTYTHLMPESEARTRRAIDEILEDGPETGDGLTAA
jgi:integrase